MAGYCGSGIALGLLDATAAGRGAIVLAAALLCVAQPVGLAMIVIGSRMAPTSAALDKREKS